MKKAISFVIPCTLVGLQTASGASHIVLDDPLLPIYLMAGAILLLFLIVIRVAIYVIRVLHLITHEDGARSTPKEPWWKRFVQTINASVPVEQESEIQLDHNYDGIRELDNHLPPWWKWTFYGSIGFAVLYMTIYHLTDALPLSIDEYKHELAVAEQDIRKYQASQPQAVMDESTMFYDSDPAAIEKGKSIFASNNCGGCHRGDGGGNTIGPNLADEYWLHGGDAKDIFQTIKNGVVEKGMPAWGKSMSAQDVRDVTFFVMSLQGTNPPDAKAPQGNVFRQVKATPDSTSTP